MYTVQTKHAFIHIHKTCTQMFSGYFLLFKRNGPLLHEFRRNGPYVYFLYRYLITENDKLH